MDPDSTPSSNEVANAIDAEVKRISDIFRFALKYKEQFQPSGIEFSDLRQYQPSDDASRIDWKNSAKSQNIYVKEFEEERDMDVFIMLDVSDTMTFGTAEKLKSEYAALVAAALAYASTDAGIHAGLGMWGEDSTILTPDGGNKQYQVILHELTNPNNYGGRFNMEEALNDTIGQIQENTSIFLISDFLDLEGDWKSKLTLSNIKFRHVMAVMIKDLRDYRLPDAGNFRFESPDGSQQVVANSSDIKEKFNRKALEDEEEMKDMLRGSGCSQLKIDTRDSFANRFAEFFEQNEGGW